MPSLSLNHQTISFLPTCFLLSNKTIVISDNYIRYSLHNLRILQCMHAVITRNLKWVDTRSHVIYLYQGGWKLEDIQ